MARRDLPDDIAKRVRAARDFEIRQAATTLEGVKTGFLARFRQLGKTLARGPKAIRDGIRGWFSRIRRIITGAVDEAKVETAAANKRREKALDDFSKERIKPAARKAPPPRPKAPRPKTVGDKLARKHLIANVDKGGTRALKSITADAAKEAARRVTRSIKVSGDLVKEASQIASDVRRLARLDPKQALRQIDALQKRGRQLSAISGDREGWAQLNRELRRIRAPIAAGLPKRGAAPAFREIASWADKQPATALRATTLDATDTIAQRWIRTEAMAAHREAGLEADRARPWIIGYRWRLQRARHGAAVRRQFGTTGSGKSRRAKRKGRIYCVCEIMDGHILSPDVMAQYPRGGHPNCNCLFEPVYDPKFLIRPL